MKENINVMIVDDHSLMREGLAKILELEENITVLDTASDGQQAIEKFKRGSYDVILLDISMPNMNGIETLRKIRDMDSSVKIIMLTVYDAREYLIETLNLGANGYMLKDSDSSSLVSAIENVYNGGTYIHPSLAGELLKEINKKKDRKKIKSGLESLTRREYEVLLLIAEGLSNKDISEKLVISEKTVKNHVSSILRKLDLSDRTQAAIYAYKHNVKKF
ncbi:two component transcriptional regulator, LuxR family [Peptoclostridium litorale DSM 5388]|uniref:Stage 0 sporulation protein A homolog n=1 Tax=Peptoclostridium litorale DSM 5388 TaxID=1121324 RepID=A0A069RJ25_PEPLI|nr:response regulator transcription factor [Peptoclostridium litorale]KDR96115.1 transcriptional regulatory protein DegU [Peptoclostridium litorale DSM 5388]SIO04321.1 two component transcriptional regulator, LuxR family [Peptoclostridium litorale DSM 5388]